jgi:HEAT repeat protein
MPLLTQLLDSSPDLASRAATALGSIGDPRATAPLASALASGPLEVRVAAAGALLRLRNAGAVPALDTAAGDAEAVVARAALAALGRIDDPAARAALLGKLGSLHGQAVSDALVEQARALRTAATLEDARANAELTALIGALASRASSPEQSAVATDNALRSLARIGKLTPIDGAIGALVGLLRDASVAQRPAVLAALATSDQDAARIALLEQLSAGPDGAARSRDLLDALESQLARAAASGKPDGRAADPLLEHLKQAETAELPQLARLLGLTEAERAAEPLVPLLDTKSAALRAAVATALGQLHAKASAPRLVALLSDEDARVRRAAAVSLRAIGDRATASALLDLLENPAATPAPARSETAARATAGSAERSMAALLALGGVLARMHDEHSVPESLAERAFTILVARVRSNDPLVADYALDALAAWGPAEAIEFLGQLLRTPSNRVRALVTAAIGRLEHEDTRQVLRYVLDQGGTRAGVAACVALAEVGDERDLGALRRVAQRRSWPLPTAATYAIAKIAIRGQIKPHVAQRALCELGASREPYVRANVAGALAQLNLAACDQGGPDPIAWLASSASPAVRFAAARWTRAALAGQRIDAKAALAALDTCALKDVDPHVRAVCRGEDLAPSGAASALTVQALPADAQASVPHTSDSLIAVRAPSGLVLLGYTDRKGELNAGRIEPGMVLVESPASAKLEAALPSAAAAQEQGASSTSSPAP